MDEPTVTCIVCYEPVTYENSVPGPGSYPVHKECLFSGSQTPEEGRHI